MIKSVIKFSVVFILTLFMALGAASTAYIVTNRIINPDKNLQEDTSSALTDNMYVPDETVLNAEQHVPDYYLVRLEGETLGVYARFSEREDFLYNADVYKTNLSSEDIRLLTSGVKLENRAALTSFIEDYTS